MMDQLSIHHFYQDKDWVNELLNPDENCIYEEVVLDQAEAGGFVAIKKHIRFLPFNYLRIIFGPDIDYNSKEMVACAMDKIVKLAKKYKSIYVQVHPFTWGSKNPEIVNLFVKKGFRKTRRYIYEATIMIDLHKTEQEIFQGFERRGREAVRQSEKRGIISSQAEITVENLDKIYAMYTDTCRRSGMIPDTKGKMVNRTLFFAKRNKAFLFFAKYENKEVCGFLAFKCGDCLSLIYQGSDYSGDIPNRRPANNLYWNTIRWAKKQGYKWFDLAGVSLDAKQGSKSEGILLFKRQFGGEVCVMPGNFEYVYRPVIKKILDNVTPIYSKFALFLQRREMTDNS